MTESLTMPRSRTKKVHANGDSSVRKRTASHQARVSEREERESLVLWRAPLTTLHYSLRELILTLLDWAHSLLTHKVSLVVLLLLAGAVLAAHRTPGAHQAQMASLEKLLLWCGWWVGLGVLSSVGLGTGLHTFILYLGPHIAAVTLAAYECGATDFPEPPYPDSIVCPEVASTAGPVTIWTILSKVRLEAFCWGAGTALGELPPYFMARAARLSGSDPEDEEDEFLELQEKLKHPEKLTRFEKAKYGVQRLVEKVGFFGILACASIPNPLFDLAGITCGHFLVPFWTFFGATLIGKAVIKMHIQKIFVILAFNEELLESAISVLHMVPYVGDKMETPVRDLLDKQKKKLHQKVGTDPGQQSNLLSSIFEKFVLAMVVYFVVSIVNSLAQSYHKRICKEKKGH